MGLETSRTVHPSFRAPEGKITTNSLRTGPYIHMENQLGSGVLSVDDRRALQFGTLERPGFFCWLTYASLRPLLCLSLVMQQMVIHENNRMEREEWELMEGPERERIEEAVRVNSATSTMSCF